MVVGEVLMNPAAVSVSEPGRVKLSANWVCAAGKEGEGAGMYEAVKAVGMELCLALGVGIPVGKDLMSTGIKEHEECEHSQVMSPLSVIISTFAPVVNTTWTPILSTIYLGRDNVSDDPASAQEKFDPICGSSYRGLFYNLTFDHSPSYSIFHKMKVVILHGQSVNGQSEMAWAFTAAGFDAVDFQRLQLRSRNMTTSQRR